MKVTLATVGSRGDVQPILALAQALVMRGHLPLIAAPPNFERWVRTHDFAFAPLGTDTQAWLAEHDHFLSKSPITMFKAMTKYFGEQLPSQFAALAATARGSRAIVNAGLAFAGPSVALHLGIPSLTVAYTTSILPARAHPPPTVPWHGLPAWMNDLLWRASNFASDALAKDALNAGRASLLLDPVSSLAEHIFGDGTIVIAADELLFPPDLAWEGRYRYANFLYYDDPRPLDPKLDAWLKAGEAPVFVGFGSMSGDGIDRVSALLTEAIVATGKRCLVGAGWAGLGAGDLPKGWRVVEEAPHALLFPRTAVVVPARAPRPMRSARVFLKSSSRSFSTSFTTRTGCTLRGFRRGRRRWRASPPRSSPPPSPSPSRSRKAREKRSPIVCVAPTVRGRS